ncbi:MAG TPA: permease-like cell division protein FtsX [Ignavibacteriaceae bacterium]|nr:permease-like cell division protein FtsX [Ignavibacteriaceae bacterium]
MFFSLKEAFRLIRRAKASFILSLVSLSISVLLIAASLAMIESSEYIQKKIKEDVSINLFLRNNLSPDEITGIKNDLKSREYIKSVSYIDKDKAAEIFIQETGDDFRKLLDYNPLPASFTITLKDKYFDKESIDGIIISLSGIKGIDDIGFRNEFIQKLISILDAIKKYIFIATGIILFISVYIVYSTVRLIITSRFEELETMKLVGAKLSTIKLPVILNSMIAGLIAGLISAGIFILFISAFAEYIDIINFSGTSKYIYLGLLICVGPFLGLIISTFSLKRLSLKI